MEIHVKREVAVVKAEVKTLKMNSISEKLIEATSSLAENLSQSEPFLQFKTAEQKLKADQQAMQLLNDFAEMQQKIRTQQHSASISESDFTRLRELQSAVGSNETIQERSRALEDAIGILREVNLEISNLLGIDFASLTRRSNGCC